ncbi:restriction endonuclease subunit S [Streptococcus macedonicus]|uniref:restriction endonuclease subunit S n=1 Tax=Streptococcus macedonicus TaxID=59310 RepID=UPI0022435007|nr:restriction endonuclease subunit S [Streptococcus macedonicus]MCW8645338.1 restriction endonuclease subunit S [Streptococcus macedonicus]
MANKVPKIRFKGFTDDWEQRKLNEVSDIYDGTHQTPKYQDDGVMFLSVENIKTLTSNKFISREAFEDEFKIRPQRGDVLMTRIGDIGTANVVETDEDLAYYVSLALFKSEELNPYFLQASIYAPFVQDQIWKRTLHIAFPKKINKNEIGQVPINVPTLAEQTKIGSFFKQLDNTITLHQRKCDQTKEFKKFMLQKMFPKKGEKNPEIRFSGFTDDWEQRELGTISDIIGGGTPSTSNSEYWNGDIDWYSPVEIGEQIYVFGSQKKITKLGLEKSSAKILPVGTVLFTSRAGIGNTAILAKEGCTNQGFQSIIPHQNELDSYLNITEAEEKIVLHNEKLEKYRKQLSEYDPEVREWAVSIYNEYGKQIHRYIGNIMKENDLFFLYNTDSEFRNASYDCYSRLIKRLPFLKDQTEMLFLFIKEYHRVESEQKFNFGIPSISEEITDWIEKTWAKHQVNLLAFAYDWINSFFDNEDIWPSTHRRKSQYNWKKYDYDYRQKSNLFNLDSLYRKMPKKSFIKSRKQEFEILFMYYWLHDMEGDDEGYWQGYLEKVLPSIKKEY